MATFGLLLHWSLRNQWPITEADQRLAGTEPILGLRLANDRRRYFVTTSLIGWAQA